MMIYAKFVHVEYTFHKIAQRGWVQRAKICKFLERIKRYELLHDRVSVILSDEFCIQSHIFVQVMLIWIMLRINKYGL